MSTSYGDETVIIPAANGAAPTPPAPGGPLFGMTPSQEAQYALDLGLGPDHLKSDARAEYDRLAKLREYRARHPEASPVVPKPVQAGDDPLSGLDPAIANEAVPPLDPAIEQQAAYAIDYGAPKKSLPPDIAAAVDRLLAEGYRERKYAAAQAARNGDGRPADYLAGLDPAIVQQAAYAIDYETDPATLSPDVQAACRALRAVGYAPGQPTPSQPRPQAGNGFTQAERSARAGKSNAVRNWFTTGDAKLDPDSEQGKALAPAVYDGWSVSSLITAFFVPLAGLILGMVAFAEAKKNHRRVHGTAVGGLIVGALGSIAWTLYWVVVIVAWISLSNAAASYPYGG